MTENAAEAEGGAMPLSGKLIADAVGGSVILHEDPKVSPEEDKASREFFDGWAERVVYTREVAGETATVIAYLDDDKRFHIELSRADGSRFSSDALGTIAEELYAEASDHYRAAIHEEKARKHGEHRARIEAAANSANTSEQAKYEAMWAHPQYRQVVPGTNTAMEFLRIAKPAQGSSVIDFGCGTGEGALMLGLFGSQLKVQMLDFAGNCLDEDVAKACVTQSQALSFMQHDLTQKVPMVAPYGICSDVMEHIPPEQLDLVLQNILEAAQHVFFQISCVDDACGVLIGQKLHLSVHPPAWWKSKFDELECQIHYWHETADACIAYVSAWATGKDVVDVGELNVALETVRANVRTNVSAGWQQVSPHEPQDAEVMIVGGGPSLAGQLEKIRELREQGTKLVTLNGAYNWALEHGLSVSAQIVVDARPFNARFTKPVQPETVYLIGSQVDPSVLEGLPPERTWLWNTSAEDVQDILEELVPGKWYGIVGGCTVLLRAIPLLRMLGYSRFHLFGCDSCVSSEAHHAYAQPENDGVPLFPVFVGGREFQCTAWQIAQAQGFIDLIRPLADLFELQVHGDGLLAWILEHAATVADLLFPEELTWHRK